MASESYLYMIIVQPRLNGRCKYMRWLSSVSAETVQPRLNEKYKYKSKQIQSIIIGIATIYKQHQTSIVLTCLVA